jgi:steroid 5-alpha reductase family enzyme
MSPENLQEYWDAMKGKSISLIGIAACIAIASTIGVAGSDGGITLGRLPVFMLCGFAAFVIQWLVFVPAYRFQTEKYYDLTGSLTYTSLAIGALMASGSHEPGAILICAMVLIWAVRLGSFLFIRIQADGKDVRFDKIKPNFMRFLMTWTLQGLWVFITFAAGLAAITSGKPHPVSTVVVVGGLMWLFGFSIEVIADRQKRKFRETAQNRETFIRHGLWRWSRHPNYFGEICLWTGVAVMAYPVLSGWQFVTLISPIFVYLLLTQVSGVKMLEARGRKRWGANEEYQHYLKTTPALMLNPWAGR